MKVYVAGPYTLGDVAQNVRAAVLAADYIAARGHTPYVPHLTHLWHIISPHVYEFWLTFDREWLAVCDAVLRLPGDSVGADAEVQLAEAQGKPIFSRIEDLP